MKKQFKKSLSLFMAMLMLLSCWVFFAPTKAEAATAGKYYVQIFVNVVNDHSNNDNKFSLNTVKQNGSAGTQWSETKVANSTGTKTYQKELDGLPSSLYVEVYGALTNVSEWYVTKVTVSPNSNYTTDQVVLWEGKFGAHNQRAGGGKSGITLDLSNGNYDSSPNIGTWTKTNTSRDWKGNPKPNSITVSAKSNNAEISSIDINQWGGANKTAAISSTIYDQYKVVWGGSVSTYALTANTDNTKDTKSSYAGASLNSYTSGDSKTLTITPTAQTANKSTTTRAKSLYVHTSYTYNNETIYGYKGITLNNPAYTYNYYTQMSLLNNGIYSNPLITQANGSTRSTKSYTEATRYYYYHPLTFPKAIQIKDSSGNNVNGYEFKGMYSTQQTVNDIYAAKYTAPSGTELSSETHTVETAANNPPLTYYAAWWAKDVEIEFKTADGQLLAKGTGKFDQTGNYGDRAATALANATAELTAKGYDEIKSGSFNGKFNNRWVVREAYDLDGNLISVGDYLEDAKLKGKTVFEPEYSYDKRNTYNINFIGENGKTLNSTTSFEYRANIDDVVPGMQTKAQDVRNTYEFMGWALRPSGNSEWEYVVDENGFTDDGTYIQTVEDFTVRKDADYVAVYKKIAREYTITYKEENKTTVIKAHYDDVITEPVPETNFIKNNRRWQFVDWSRESGTALANGKCRGNVTYVAEYYDTEVRYTIRFFDHTHTEESGVPINQKVSYSHGDTVEIPWTMVEQVYRDDNYQYEFGGWLPEYPSSTATKDIDYIAHYDAKPLYTVNYYNGDELIEGSSVKEVAGADISNSYAGAIPEKEGDKYAAEYTFSGWADENGNPVTTLGNSDINLYAQYDFTPTKYTVEFRNEDGSLITVGVFNYLDSIEHIIPEDGTVTKAADETYNYDFRGWDKDIDLYCEDTVTYTAVYRRTYNYYTVEWLDEFAEEVVNTQKYIYNERINPPAAPETTEVSTDPNYTWVFDAWLNADTNEKFTRGDRITGNVRYKASYKLEANICTVELYDEDGTTLLETIKVPYGTTDIMSVAGTYVKQATDAEHYNFTEWTQLDGSKFTKVENNMKLKANYEAEEHTWVPNDVTVEPTFFTEGKGTEICSNASCHLEKEVVIAKLEDIVPPTAKLYVSSHTWSTPDTDHDYVEAIPVAPSNMFIINTDDTAMRDKYNPLAIGSGTGTISYSIQSGEVAPDSITDWITWYDYDELPTERIGKEANITAKLSDIFTEENNIENGSTFVIYGKIVDRCGNTTYINSDLLIYDDVMPVVEVTSDHQNGSKHCLDATITVESTDDLAAVRLNGKTIELDKDGKALVTEPGIYQVSVVDVAGNETKVNFDIIGSHDLVFTNSSANCTTPGGIIARCKLCGIVDEEQSTVIEAKGHQFEEVTVEAGCITGGYKYKICVVCGITEMIPDSETPAVGHTWVEDEALRKEPTCSTTGLMIKFCSVCGEMKPESPEDIIPSDLDKHVFYREKQTKDPTCTEDGQVTKTCKYDSTHVEVVRTVPALGHDEGVWTVTKEPTCQETGSRVLNCTRCGEKIKEETLEKIDHVYTVTLTDTKEEEGFTIYTYTYTCTMCPHSYTKDVKEAKLAKHTVTFVGEDGKTIKAITKFKGEAVVSADIESPTKDADKTYRYTFSGWADKDGKEVKFPIVIGDEDITLSPVFTKSYVSYTITLYKEDGTQYNNKIGYLHNDDSLPYVLPKNGPEKASTATYDYEFAGWSPDGKIENVVTEIKEFTEDLTFIATYKSVEREYKVVFALDTDHVLTYADGKSYKMVKAGEDATNLYDGATPTKAYDAEYHYVFNNTWRELKQDSLKNIQADTIVFAQFDAIKHDYTSKVIQEQKYPCMGEEITRYTCECGHYYDDVTKSQVDHKWSDTPDENGKVTCIYKCGTEQEDTRTFTVTFLDWDGSVIKTIDYIKYGEDISDRIPTPTRAADNQNYYEFSGWDTSVENIVKANATYTAQYDATARLYKVIFGYNSKNVIKVFENQPLMDDFSVIYDEDVYGKPTKSDYDDYGHYEFIGWSNRGIDEKNQSVFLEALFQKVSHDYAVTKTEANCEVGAGTTYTCKICGQHYTKETSAPLGHNWQVIETVEPTYNKAGYIKYKCANCGEEYQDDLAMKQMIRAEIHINDKDGHPIEGAKVTLFDLETGAFVASSTSGSDGIATVRVPAAGKYTITIDADGIDQFVSTVTISSNGKVTNGWKDSDIIVIHCDCTCHKDGLWAKIFRFFHKIIKAISGSYKCCNNPDPKYN
ncbi:MAG: carboxypeptidase-like regulatory domain-containing protein [Faecalibacterium sp.]|nr:carboxypeptidase-like regulatory domain-containing protein [Ruminococcus sp.]MCM1391315.1 carboxypeptidase-like regulatory domain-containing protein [Ruminococcus sp.]MCM1484869.1 carboxypeptidase-like regulatory domain-containing protein [Faecalibacterium sp.]